MIIGKFAFQEAYCHRRTRRFARLKTVSIVTRARSPVKVGSAAAALPGQTAIVRQAPGSRDSLEARVTAPLLHCAQSRLRETSPPCKAFAMLKVVLTALMLAATSSMAFAEASRPTRFWNLTRHTISELYSGAGRHHQFRSQSVQERQGRHRRSGRAPADHRRRAREYDAKLKDVSGRSCLVRNVKVEAGEIFSIEEKELTSCTR